MIKHILIAGFSLAILGSCKGTDKLSNSGSKQVAKIVACSNVPIDLGKPHIDWYEEKRSVLISSNNRDNVLVLPKEYEVYSISNTQVAQFFTAVKGGEQLQMVVPLPYPSGCRAFSMVQDKEGATQQLTNTERQYKLKVAYDGNIIGGYATVDDETYRLMPVKNNDKWYCVIYKKEKRMSNDNAVPKGQVIKKRYDK